MIINNCLIAADNKIIAPKAVAITVFLFVILVIYRKRMKKRLSPISLIMISAAAGIVVYGV